MKDLHFVGEITQKALIVKDGKVLLTRDLDDDKWDFPGGRIHRNEDPKEGLLREIKEEVGLTGKIDNIFDASFVTFQDNIDRMMLVYKCRIEGNDEITLQVDEIGEAVWVSKDSYLDYPLYPEFESLLGEFFN